MAHDEPLIVGQPGDFIDLLQSLSFKFTFDPATAAASPAVSGLNSERISVSFPVPPSPLSVDGPFNNFLRTFASAAIPPRTWDNFITAWRDFEGLSSSFGDPRDGPAFDGFVDEFKTILGIPLSGGSLGDWDPLAAEANIPELFVQSFDHFLETYPFVSGDDAPFGTIDTFFTNWRTFMTVTTVLSVASTTGDYADLSSYEAVYNAFFPNAVAGDFQNRLVQFFQDQINEEGYFVPSQLMNQWFDTIQGEYLNGVTQGNATSSIAGTGSEKALILNQIFVLLISLIETLQRVAASQAERLGFLTNYQRAYTDLLAQIPVFTEGDDSFIGGDDDDQAEARRDLNQKNSVYTENLRSFRSIIGDDARQLQSNVNQSNEAVNQQANLATSIIQQFSTILQSIFR